MTKLSKKARTILDTHNIPYTDINTITKNGNKAVYSYIVTPDGKLMNFPLKPGTDKIGKKCFAFGTLATDRLYIIDGIGEIMGTCCITCTNSDGDIDCYACMGHYKQYNVKLSLAHNTLLAYKYIDFLYRLISAQLEIIGGGVDIRIHVAGDFFNDVYSNMWHRIAAEHPKNRFWAYTKNEKYERLFDDLSNANIVKSNIAGIGFNFGHIDYILALYEHLTAIGKKAYICPCGVDDTIHCQDCNICIEYEYVLFIEHSTEYKAKDDPLYPFISEIVKAQNGGNQLALASRINTYITTEYKAA